MFFAVFFFFILKISSDHCLNVRWLWLKPDRIYGFGAARRVQPPRSRSSTGKTKKKLKLNRSPTVWTTGVHSAAFDWVSMVFCGVPLRASVLSCVLTSDRCLGARVFLRSRRWFFFPWLAPRGFFLDWKGRGVFFWVSICGNNKKSPRTGRFFTSVELMWA